MINDGFVDFFKESQIFRRFYNFHSFTIYFTLLNDLNKFM